MIKRFFNKASSGVKTLFVLGQNGNGHGLTGPNQRDGSGTEC